MKNWRTTISGCVAAISWGIVKLSSLPENDVSAVAHIVPHHYKFVVLHSFLAIAVASHILNALSQKDANNKNPQPKEKP